MFLDNCVEGIIVCVYVVPKLLEVGARAKAHYARRGTEARPQSGDAEGEPCLES